MGVPTFHEVMRGEPSGHFVVLHDLAGNDSGLVASNKNHGLKRSLMTNECEEIGPLRIGDYETIATPMPGYNFIEEVPSLKMPSCGAGVLADNSDRAGIIPTQRHKNATFKFYLLWHRLHVLADRLHKRVFAGN
jgi:hypothetical protein